MLMQHIETARAEDDIITDLAFTGEQLTGAASPNAILQPHAF